MRCSCGVLAAELKLALCKSRLSARSEILCGKREVRRVLSDFFAPSFFFALHVAILWLVLSLTGGDFGDFDGSAALFEEGFKVGGVQPYGTSNYPFIIEVYFTS